MYVNLDHSPSVEAAKAGIDAGFEFVHIDYSQANRDATDEEIIAATREVVDYAEQTTGALVESEPHYFGGSSNVHTEAIDYEEIRKTFSTPEGARAFVAATGIDTFAAAVGNLHGRYPVPKQLDLELLQRIRDADRRATSACTAAAARPATTSRRPPGSASARSTSTPTCGTPTARTLEAQLKANPDQYAVVKIIGPVIDAVQKVVEERIDRFGSAGQARP